MNDAFRCEWYDSVYKYCTEGATTARATRPTAATAVGGSAHHS